MCFPSECDRTRMSARPRLQLSNLFLTTEASTCAGTFEGILLFHWFLFLLSHPVTKETAVVAELSLFIFSISFFSIHDFSPSMFQPDSSAGLLVHLGPCPGWGPWLWAGALETLQVRYPGHLSALTPLLSPFTWKLFVIEDQTSQSPGPSGVYQ